MVDVLIIGCGVVGAATAYKLSKYKISVAVLEKENDVATGTSKANSGIVHAGYDPEPGTLMAKLNVKGAGLTEALCRDLDVPYKKTGSMVLAFDEEDLKRIETLYERGLKNGVAKLELLTGEQAKKLELNLSDNVKGALYAPTAGIVNPWEYTLAMAETAVRNGAEIHLNNEVRSIAPIDGGYRVKTNKGLYEAKYIINAAGLHGDEIHNMAAEPEFKIHGVRGEYYLLDKAEGQRAKFVLFQCPTRAGKGVLVSPTVHGNLIVGPNAEDVAGKDDVATTAGGLSFVKEMAFRTIPSIHFRESIRNFSGVRAVADTSDDFIIKEANTAENFFDLAGIKSPGLTSAPAIAEMAAGMLADKGLALVEKESYIGSRRKIRFKELSTDEKNRLIMKKPEYGRVICRCETVTEGEIIEALHSPITPVSIDGIKRRCNAGMGRCQGGFCGPRVLEIIARELKISPLQVMQDKDGSFILTGETKAGGDQNV